MLASSPLLAMGGLNAGLLGRLGGVSLSAQEDDGIIVGRLTKRSRSWTSSRSPGR